jgi:tRNA(Ile)-lysidine synthase
LILGKMCYNNSMVINKVRNTILHNNLIEKGEHIVMGLSGGPDSVCLFYILNQLKEEFELSLHAVHINHQLRPGAAEEDQRYAEELCHRFGVPCRVDVYDVNRIAKEKGISSEDAGRQVRYQSFFEEAKSVSEKNGVPVKIAVAQNLNDQAETLLMRIMRGTGTEGLAGIEYKRKDRSGAVIIRPLLDVSRAEIEAFCKENNLNPRIDLTNLEPIYTRNKIRLELLPYIQENFNGNVMEAINRLSRIAKEDKNFFSQRIEELMFRHCEKIWSEGRDCADSVSFPIEVLREQHPALRHRLIMKLFESIGLDRDISAIHLEQADKLLLDGKTSSVAEFSSDYVMKISYGSAEFYKKRDNWDESFEYDINMNGITEIHELNKEIGVRILRRKEWENVNSERKTLDSTSFSCSMSYDEIQKSHCHLILRTRREGDYIVPLGMKGKKKLQDFFVDAKIKKENRDRIPLLCLGSEIIWIVGYRISENYKIQNHTKHMILLEFYSKK